MADLYNRRESLLDYLPGDWQQAINTSPVVNALGRAVNRPTPDLTRGIDYDQYGSVSDRNWLLEQARGGPPKLNPLAAEMLDKGGTLAMFLGAGARLRFPKSGEAYPLANLDPAARVQRARTLGFDTDTVWYHGSPEGKLPFIKPGVREPGAWFTTDLMNANNYARGSDAGLYSVFLRSKNPYVVESLDDLKFVPAHKGQPLDIWDNVSLVEHARRQGYDSVHFPRGNFSESGNTMVMFDPSSIRATTARFLPGSSSALGLYR